MALRRIKLSKRHRLWLYGSFTLLFGSGAIWFLAHYFLNCPQESFSDIRFMESISLKIHGAAAMVTLIMLGSLIPTHIKIGLVTKVNRLRGIIFIGVNILLIVTGYGLYYSGDENLRSIVQFIHIYIGLAFPFFLVWHIGSGRKKMRAQIKNQ